MLPIAGVTSSIPLFSLEVDAYARLIYVGPDGERVENVTPVRAFPLSSPERWVAIRDRQGRELVLIKDPAMLPTSVRTLLDQELARREFSPRILQIYNIHRADYGIDWEVETDRGRVSFRVEGDESIRELGERGTVIIDSSGIRYRIFDVNELDRASRRRLEKYF